MDSELDLKLEDFYLDYLNNFLTVESFAAYYGISVELANLIIEEGRQKQVLIEKLDN